MGIGPFVFNTLIRVTEDSVSKQRWARFTDEERKRLESIDADWPMEVRSETRVAPDGSRWGHADEVRAMRDSAPQSEAKQ